MKRFLVKSLVVCMLLGTCNWIRGGDCTRFDCWKFTGINDTCNDGPFWTCGGNGGCTDFLLAGPDDGATWERLVNCF